MCVSCGSSRTPVKVVVKALTPLLTAHSIAQAGAQHLFVALATGPAHAQCVR